MECQAGLWFRRGAGSGSGREECSNRVFPDSGENKGASEQWRYLRAKPDIAGFQEVQIGAGIMLQSRHPDANELNEIDHMQTKTLPISVVRYPAHSEAMSPANPRRSALEAGPVETQDALSPWRIAALAARAG